jgi:serine/threonine protein kinase
MKFSPKVCSELFPGKSISKISHLGSGRMGNVYKVELDNDETLCIKVLAKADRTKIQDSTGWKLAYSSQNFDFKFCEDNQNFFFTIPYFEGELFHSASQYNLKSRFQIIQNLIKATADMHSKGLIHRDLKCNNIIINKEAENKVSIIDFGRSVDVFSLHKSRSVTDYIQNLQLPGQGATSSNIRRIFQPYTAPEYFRKQYNNNSIIGFRSDYYSIAQLFRFLIPEYSYLADKILHTEGIDRNAAFSEFSSKIDNALMDNKFNPSFYETNNSYYALGAFYRKIIFFIRQILDRLFTLTFQSSDPTPKHTVECNNHKNITLRFFKRDKKNSRETNLAGSLPNSFTLSS